MKKIIALTSLLFVLLMSVLPAQTAQVSAAANVGVTGVTMITSEGKEIKATGTNNMFNFSLNGVAKDTKVNEVRFYSETATYLSYLPREILSPEEYDFADVKFDGGVAYLNSAKLLNWAVKNEFPIEEVPSGNDFLFTVQDILEILVYMEDEPLELYAGDASGNETAVALTFTVDGWVFVDGEWFFFKNGKLAKGWAFTGGKWYYLDLETGVMLTGWKFVNGKWYFFENSGAMKTGWLFNGGKWYYLDAKNGDMKTGWVFVGGKWYYFENSGAMKTSWVLLGGKWYFLDRTNGDMKTGWVLYNNKWYYLNTTSGAMATNTWVSGKYWVNKDGVWVK